MDVSPVMGKGFNLAAVPVEEVPTLLLFATGSGIAPIRALIDSERLQVCSLIVGSSPQRLSAMLRALSTVSTPAEHVWVSVVESRDYATGSTASTLLQQTPSRHSLMSVSSS